MFSHCFALLATCFDFMTLLLASCPSVAWTFAFYVAVFCFRHKMHACLCVCQIYDSVQWLCG